MMDCLFSTGHSIVERDFKTLRLGCGLFRVHYTAEYIDIDR